MTRENRTDELTAKSDNRGSQSMLCSCDMGISEMYRESHEVIAKVIKKAVIYNSGICVNTSRGVNIFTGFSNYLLR